MMKKFLWAFCLGACLAPSFAAALEFKPAARLNGRYNLDQMDPFASTATNGASGESFLIPALMQGDWTLLPLFAILAKDSDRAIEEDTLFVQSYTFMAKPQLRWQHGDAQYKVFAGAKRAVNKETVGEVWSTGKYDYEEFGGGLGLKWKEPLTLLASAGATAELLHRTYMNWHELATVSNKNYYTKDYDGLKVNLDIERAKGAAFPWTAGYMFLLKNFTDSYRDTPILKPDINAGLRQDMLHRVDASVEAPLGGAFLAGLTLGFDYNSSNAGYLDPFTLKDFDKDYYGYHSESLGMTLAWFPKGNEGPSLTPRYSITNRNYLGRSIRNPDGTYTQGKQADLEHRVGLDGRWPLAKWVAVTGGVEYFSELSNQAFIVRIQNTYDLFKAGIGLDLSY